MGLGGRIAAPSLPLAGRVARRGSDGSGGGCAELSGWRRATPSPLAALGTLPSRGRDEAHHPCSSATAQATRNGKGRLARQRSSTKRFGIVGTSQTSMRLIV